MANQITDRVAEQIETRLADQKSRAADKVSSVAQTLHSSSQQLRQDGNDDVGRYVERAADQVERIANYLNSTEMSDVVNRVEDFARRQPAAFMASAFAVGFVASRFLKSSRDQPAGYLPESTGGAGSYETGSNFDYSHSGTSQPRTETWRESGYAASETDHTSNIVGDPSVRTSAGLETNGDTNRGV